jgi:hypothetical protein
MRFFANLFLLLFLVDGGLSLVDGLVSLVAPLFALTGLRGILAEMVMLMAIPLYLLLGLDCRLPKRILLPQIMFVFWCPLSLWIFPQLDGSRSYGLLLAVAQVALGLLPLALARNDNSRSLLLPQSLFAAPMFKLRNSLVFGATNLLMLPLVVIILLLYTANAYMTRYTSGFMRISPGRLIMTEKVYQRDHRTIRLAAMIHLGEKQYYDELARSIVPGRTIILAEGVSDAKQLLRNRIDYGRVAGFLGLESQEQLHFPGKLIEADELDTAVAEEQLSPRPADILRADVDVSDFRPSTLLFLNAVGKQLGESPSFLKGFLSLNAWAEQHMTPEMNNIILNDILHLRNKALIRYLGKALDRYDTIVIPWGALHMKAIEEEVLQRGFKLSLVRERVSIDFLGKLPDVFK